ncbi:MAG: NUDIX domain-containing protein, partial [Nocardioidaceae bacterium]
MADEQVALYDEAGRPCGSAPRSRVRAENLHHAATAVVVRDSFGRVYVHRRTDTKDVYPGLYDFAAGGCVLSGEDPHDAALREAAEELGATGVDLEPIREADYADEHTRYRGFCYVTTYDGPIRWQPEEVAWGDWVSLDRLVEMLDSPGRDVVPDSVGLLGDWVRERHGDRLEVPQGWDSRTEIVEGRWADRRPRRPETAAQLLRETRLMPAIAPRLPLEVPVPVAFDESPLRVRH